MVLPSPAKSTTRPKRTEPIVLIADDDPGIRVIVSQLLRANGFYAISCSDGQSAVELVRQLRPSLAILDINMPVMDGLTACQAIRRETDIPIVMLTVMDDESDASRALDSGADDYIRKPFGAKELVSRLKALIRRSGSRGSGELFVVGSLKVDARQRIASIGGEEIHLSSTEFDMLAYLAANLNRVVTHAQILDHIWGYDYSESRQVVRLVIHRLRRRVALSGGIKLETMVGVGYRLRMTAS